MVSQQYTEKHAGSNASGITINPPARREIRAIKNKMKITCYANEKSICKVAKARGWKFASSAPNDGTAELHRAVYVEIENGMIVREVLRAKDANGCESDYMFFYRP